MRQQETDERLSLLEEQLSVKEKAIALMEADLQKVKGRTTVVHTARTFEKSCTQEKRRIMFSVPCLYRWSASRQRS